MVFLSVDLAAFGGTFLFFPRVQRKSVYYGVLFTDGEGLAHENQRDMIDLG